MTSPTASACGSRTPTVHRVPAGALDYGLADDVIAWLRAVNINLFDWQFDVLRDALARNDAGKWAAYEVSLVVPRQNGKNEILAALEFASVALLHNRLVVHSAHETATAQKHFQRMQDIAERNSEIRKHLPNSKTLGFYTSNGKEHIRFRNGGIIEFKARTKSSARGFSSDLVVLDEAFDLDPRAVGSMMYTLRARVDPQVWRTSSPAHADSVVLHNDRRRAESDDPDDSRFMYVDWSNPQGVDPSDPAVWLRSNPSIGAVADGFELELETFRNEYAAAKDSPELLAEFVREVCGVADVPIGEQGSIIPNWSELVVDASPMADGRQWALVVNPERTWASIGGAGRTAEGKLQVGWLEHRAGTAWIVDRVAEMYGAARIPLRVHKSGPEAAFIAPLRERGVEVVEVPTAEVARATGLLMDAAASGELVHLGQPSLDKAVRGAVLRMSSDGAAVWSQRQSSVEITPLQAVTVALGGVPEMPGERFFVY